MILGLLIQFYSALVASSFSGTLDVPKELLRLDRCYALLVRERIPLNDPLRVSVQNGTMSGSDACMSVFDRAQLNDQGELSKVNGVPDPIGGKILSNMVKATQSWLHGTQDPKPVLDAAMDIFDSNEPGYSWTYVLFKQNEPFSNLITRTKGIRSIRSTSREGKRTVPLAGPGYSLNFTQGSDSVTLSPVKPFNPELVATGTLIGLKEDTVTMPVSAGTSILVSETEDWKDHDANRHFGAGFIGSQAYLYLNNNKLGSADGAAQNFRIWSNSVFTDALCRTIPLLRSSDVLSFVQTESSLPWRHGISCMGCHASIDYLSGGIRNIQRIYSSTSSFPVMFWTKWRTKFPVAEYGSTPVMEKDLSYKGRPLDGSLRYRSYDGRLVNLDFRGLGELGTLLADTNNANKIDDFYACASKRYYAYFTGIDVNLGDIEDPLNPLGLNPKELSYRNRVIELGKELKKSQNLRSLIRSIIESETFVYPDKGI